MLEMLALNDSAFKLLRIANDERELAVIQLCSCLNSLSVFLNELLRVL